MSKNTIGCRIKSFIPIENMNVEKLRAAKIYVYLRKLAKSVLKANSQA